VYLGVIKIIVALTMGSAAEHLLIAFPNSVLGVLLIFSGIELASAGRKIQVKDDANLAFLTAGTVCSRMCLILVCLSDISDA